MALLWDKLTTTVIEGLVTLDKYYLYTMDIPRVRGGLVGLNYDLSDQSAGAHQDVFRDARDHQNNWVKVAHFELEALHLVHVYVQSTGLGGDEFWNAHTFSMIRDGKPMLIPLNSGPDYLATRPDTEYILLSPSMDGAVSCVVENVHDQYGYTPNYAPAPSHARVEQNTLATNKYRHTILTADTATDYQEESFFAARYYITIVGNEASAPVSKLQAPLATGTDTAVVATRTGSIYTGGEVVFYYSYLAYTGSPTPSTLSARMRLGSTTVIAHQTGTQIATKVIADKTFYLYRVASTLSLAVGTNLKAHVSYNDANDHFRPEAVVSGVGVLQRSTYVAWSDPWESFKMPPQYTTTTTSGRCLTGGFIA